MRTKALERILKIDKEKFVKRRQKKTREQLMVLESEFLKDPHWSHEKNVQLALSLNLTVD